MIKLKLIDQKLKLIELLTDYSDINNAITDTVELESKQAEIKIELFEQLKIDLREVLKNA